MAEIPEIIKYSAQMNTELRGKTISAVTLLQEKNLNVSPEEFTRRCLGASVKSVGHKGKWIVLPLDNGENILISLGMGADILCFKGEPDGEKYHVRLDFSNGRGFTIRYWWFGRFMIVTDNELPNEPSTCDIALDPFDSEFTYDYFSGRIKGKNTQIKAFLMNQRNVGGIGNMYMHDILFLAGLHPKRKISSMTDEDIKRLYDSIQTVLRRSLAGGTFSYEKDFYGNPGGLTLEDLIIPYRENAHCPNCDTVIEQIKAGGSSTYICPECQRL